MLFGETVAVYCENRTEHTNTLCGYFSPYLTGDTSRLRYRANRLMLCEKTVAVYCENRTEHTNTLCWYFCPYLTGDTLRLRYRAQPINAVWGNSRCLL
jgi:hypothetical protein